MREKNQMLKEQNIKLRSEITFLGNRINILTLTMEFVTVAFSGNRNG